MGGDDDDDDSESNNKGGLGSLASLIRLTNVNVPGRARIVAEGTISATLYSLTLGLSSGAVGAIATSIGPLVPFMIGSSIGYSFGFIHYWCHNRRLTLDVAQEYPTLLAHALKAERNIKVPSNVLNASIEAIKCQNQEQDSYEMEPQDNNGTYNSSQSSSIAPRDITLDQWILNGGLGRLSWAMFAAKICQQDVYRIRQEERRRVVDAIINDNAST